MIVAATKHGVLFAGWATELSRPPVPTHGNWRNRSEIGLAMAERWGKLQYVVAVYWPRNVRRHILWPLNWPVPWLPTRPVRPFVRMRAYKETAAVRMRCWGTDSNNTKLWLWQLELPKEAEHNACEKDLIGYNTILWVTYPTLHSHMIKTPTIVNGKCWLHTETPGLYPVF